MFSTWNWWKNKKSFLPGVYILAVEIKQTLHILIKYTMLSLNTIHAIREESEAMFRRVGTERVCNFKYDGFGKLHREHKILYLKEWERHLPAYLEERAFQTEKKPVKGSNMRVYLASFRAANNKKTGQGQGRDTIVGHEVSNVMRLP